MKYIKRKLTKEHKSIAEKKLKKLLEGLLGVFLVLLSGYVLSSFIFFNLIEKYKIGNQRLLFVYLQIACLAISLFFYMFIFENFSEIRNELEWLSNKEIKVALLFTTSVLLGGSIAFGINGGTGSGQIAFTTVQSSFLLTVLSMSLTATLEEILFRGVFQRRLEYVFSKYTAIIVPSLVFSLTHFLSLGGFKFKQIISLFILGCVFGYIYNNFKNLSLAVLCHIIYNISILSTFYIFS